MSEIRRPAHGPFSGYVSAVAKDLIPMDAAGPDSRDYEYDPELGKWFERAGSAIVGDTFGAIVGILEQNASYRCRRILEFPAIKDQAGTDQFTAGTPSHMALWDGETFYGGVGYQAKGALSYRSPNGTPSYKSVGQGFSATTYPTTARSTKKSFMKAMADWTADGDVCSRLGSGSLTYRQFLFAGGRGMKVIGDWLYTVGVRVLPKRWNMLYNDSLTVPTRKERHWPMGILPVLFPAWIKAADFPTPKATPDESWKEGDAFFISATYEFEDGTIGPPFIPRALYDAPYPGNYANGYGYVKLQSGTPGTTWRYIAWANIAQPPPGCVATHLWRTPKVNGAGFTPAITDKETNLPNFGWIARIPKGVTSYKDEKGNDADLLFDSERFRFDQIAPPRSRYIGVAEGRVFLAYTMPSPQLIYVSHTGTTNPNDNTDDDDATMGTIAYFVRTVGSNLQLRSSVASTGVTTTNTISMSGKTLLELVDAINATTPASTTGEWRAQLAGAHVDGSILATTAIRDMSISDNYADDPVVNDGTTGNQQSYAQGYPATLQWGKAALLATQQNPDREGIYFTRGAPESAAKGVTAAPNFWVAGNYRPPLEYSGTFMGFAAVEDGMVCFYSDKVWLLRNTKDFRSGRDEDFYMTQISNDGCIAWNSIVEFNNAVGWLTKNGYMVWGRDLGQQNLTRAIFNPSGGTDNTGSGDLVYEVGQCAASAAADSDGMRFSAYRFGQVLTIKYRSSSSVTAPDMEQKYDFSEGSHSGGVAGLFRDGNTNTPFGWSTPLRRPGETMGEHHGASGIVKLHAIDITVGSTGNGRIDQMDTGFQDNGVAITPVLYTRMDNQGTANLKRELAFELDYVSPTGHSMVLTHSRDRARLSAETYVIDNTLALKMATLVERIKLVSQAPGMVSEYNISGTRVASAPAEVWALRRKTKVLDTPPGQRAA